MEELKWSSLVGFFTIAYVVVVVVVRYFTYRRGQHPAFSPQQLHEKDSVDYTSLSTRTFSALTLLGTCFSYQFNTPYFYRELKDRTRRKMMLSCLYAFPIILSCYVLTGLFGYLTFGALVGSAHAGGNIVNNYAADDALVNVARLGLFVHFVSVYPILSVSVRRGVHRLLLMVARGEQTTANEIGADEKQFLLNDEEQNGSSDPNDSTARWAIVLEAFLIVTTSVALAAIVPGIGIVLEFGGIFGYLFGLFVVPGVIGLCIFAPGFGPACSASRALGYDEEHDGAAPNDVSSLSFRSTHAFAAQPSRSLRAISFVLLCCGGFLIVGGTWSISTKLAS